jgi:hypothetical protein
VLAGVCLPILNTPGGVMPSDLRFYVSNSGRHADRRCSRQDRSAAPALSCIHDRTARGC